MPIDIPETDDLRVCKRINLDFLVSLQHPDGSLLEGLTIDVSLGGVKVACQFPPDKKWHNAAIIFYLLNAGSVDEEFHAEVQRLDNKLLALKLEKDSAIKFGLAISRDQFRRPDRSGD